MIVLSSLAICTQILCPALKGWLRASYREIDAAKSKPGQPFHSYRNPTLLEPGKVYEFQIEMLPVFHTFRAGHKIWVQIASDDNPIVEALNSHTMHTIYKYLADLCIIPTMLY